MPPVVGLDTSPEAVLFGDGIAVSEVPLDLKEGIVSPGSGANLHSVAGSKCERWPEGLMLRGVSPGGKIQYRKGRCKATNKCDYCARMFARETCKMLELDACEWAPNIYVVLTSREQLTRADCRRHLEHLRKSLRRRWPVLEWAVIVEFTTGKGRLSGGLRRLHLNLLVKGVPAEEFDDFGEWLRILWTNRVDAEERYQFVGNVYEGPGLVRYLSLHFLKPGQAPPKGWSAHRFSTSRGYLVRDAPTMRKEARHALAVSFALKRGVPPELVDLEVELEDEVTWELMEVVRSPGGLILRRRRVSDNKRAEVW